MRTVLIAAVLLAGCRRDPGRGETICTTNFGVTKCNSGPPAEDDDEDEDSDERPAKVAPAPQAAVFWCATRASDGFGYCTTQPGECENARGSTFAACVYQGHAICATSGCFTTPEGCAKVERLAKRDGNACALRR